MARARNWCFTLNNYKEEDPDKLLALPCAYIIIGKEVGDFKTPHLQGYVEFSTALRLTGLKKIDPRIHWEPRRGTREQARDYCMKDGDYLEHGVWRIQGERTDLKKFISLVREKKKYSDIIEEVPAAAKMPRTYQLLKAEVDEETAPKWRDVEVIVFVGPTGVGKTRQAVSLSDNYYKLDPANSLWFDGYNGQELLIIDDFYGYIKYGHMLQLLDGYKMRLELKGSFTYARWTKVVITSNSHPDKWYPNIVDTSALLRRIKLIKEFS